MFVGARAVRSGVGRYCGTRPCDVNSASCWLLGLAPRSAQARASCQPGAAILKKKRASVPCGAGASLSAVGLPLLCHGQGRHAAGRSSEKSPLPWPILSRGRLASEPSIRSFWGDAPTHARNLRCTFARATR